MRGTGPSPKSPGEDRMTLTPTGPSARPLHEITASIFSGMDKADALAFVARAFDAKAAGDHAWDDDELITRFLSQCSRTGSQETISGYRREIDAFRSWRWHRASAKGTKTQPIRTVTPGEAQEWVDDERELVTLGTCKPRTFNRRIAAVSALFRWASEPSRSAITGIPRNPLPRRVLLTVAKQPKPLTAGDLDRIIEAIKQAGHQRDLVLIKGSYLLGCRVSEMAGLKWGDIEALEDAGQVTVLGKGSKTRTIRISTATLELFLSIKPEHASEDDWCFPSERRGSGHLTRQAIGARVRHWGKRALGQEARVWPHRLRGSHATHAIRAGVDVFTLQTTLGHASTSTTQGYVAANPADSSSLKLG